MERYRGRDLWRRLHHEGPHQGRVQALQDEPVCAAFITVLDDEVFIPWAGSLFEYRRFGINMAMYWDMIAMAIDDKKRYFNFGRSTRNCGTYKFKKQWGAVEEQLYQYEITLPDMKHGESRVMQLAQQVIEKSPPVVMQVLSKLFLHRFY